MGDVDEVAAILDLITATQIQLHAMALVWKKLASRMLNPA